MGRELTKTEQNKIILFDKISGTKLEVYYRTITAEDRIRYKSEILNQLTKNRDIEGTINLQLIWSEKIITGFREGDFTIEGEQISSDPNSDKYYQGWFAVLKETATDILLTIVDTVLGESSFVLREENNLPFVKN